MSDLSVTVCLVWLTRGRRQFLGARNLDTHIRAILLIDRGSYDNPKAFVDRNSYFFKADTRDALPPSKSDNDSILQSRLESAIERFMSSDTVRTTVGSTDSADHSDLKQQWSAISDTAKVCNDVLADICREEAMSMLGDSIDGVPIVKTQAYKDWTKAVHLYLRERLSYGVPCPSTGLVMAVLGYEECLRRISR